MSAAKHTPGPWYVEPWNSVDRDGAIHACGYQIISRAAGQIPTGIDCSAGEGDDLHDLHLIAAAPELLELAELISAFSFTSDVPLGDIQKKARSAIAKARWSAE